MQKTKKSKEENYKMSNITQKWVEVFKPFTRNYFSKFTATEIARFSGVPQQTASRILNYFEELKLLNYYLQGKNKLFYLDNNKLPTFLIFEIIENTKAMEFSINFVREFLIVSKLASCSDGLILFGSYASGRPKKDSDLDVVFVGEFNKKAFDEIKESSPIEIHEQSSSYLELKEKIATKHPLALEIFNNHILFGNTSKIVKTFLEAQNGRA